MMGLKGRDMGEASRNHLFDSSHRHFSNLKGYLFTKNRSEEALIVCIKSKSHFIESLGDLIVFTFHCMVVLGTSCWSLGCPCWSIYGLLHGGIGITLDFWSDCEAFVGSESLLKRTGAFLL